MKNLKTSLLVIVFCSTYLTGFNQIADSNVFDVTDKIEYAYFHKHLEYLASDELEGRGTGSEGYAIAAQYVADEFKNNGLEPFGDGNTYFQKVPLINKSIDKSTIKVLAEINDNTVEGIYGENISFLMNPSIDEIDLKQKLVFVGYGNIIPGDSIDDYEGVDVKGKIVIVALGAPKTVNGGSGKNPFTKIKNAVNKGADGIILFYPGNLLQGKVYKELHGFLDEPITSIADTSISKSMFDIDMEIGSFAKKDFINDVFTLNGLSLKKTLKSIKKGNVESKELESELKCSFNTIKESIDCKNVVALLPGTDSILKDEYLVLGAHLDHLGIGKAVKGDSIYNGMWDNATGSAAIVSMSKAYADLAVKPKRSVVFICYTGEEKGLLGSSYYANSNNVTDGKIIANLNIDMLGNLFETTDIIPLGYSHSNLSEAVDFGSNYLNLDIDDNKKEEHMYFERSDQFSFVENEVPALNIGTGYTAKDPKINAYKSTEKWMKKRYHSPSDDLSQEYSEKAFLTYLKVNFLASYYISHELGEVIWNTDSWVYEKYVSKETK